MIDALEWCSWLHPVSGTQVYFPETLQLGRFIPLFLLYKAMPCNHACLDGKHLQAWAVRALLQACIIACALDILTLLAVHWRSGNRLLGQFQSIEKQINYFMVVSCCATGWNVCLSLCWVNSHGDLVVHDNTFTFQPLMDEHSGHLRASRNGFDINIWSKDRN